MELSKETIKTEKPLLNTFQFVSIRGKLKVTLRTTHSNLRKYTNDMIMKIKFRIKKYSQVFNSVSMWYSGLSTFTLVDQEVLFSREGCNFSFINI